MIDLLVGIAAGSLLAFLACTVTFRSTVRGLECGIEVRDEQIEELAKWKAEAISLAHNDAYRGLHSTVIEVEDRLNINPSQTLTVSERWEKLSGRIDPHMLKLLLGPRFKRTDSPQKMRAAARMLTLRHAVDVAPTENERAAAQRALDSLTEKYG